MRIGLPEITLLFHHNPNIKIKIFGITCFVACVLYISLPVYSVEHTVSLQLKWLHQFQFAGYYAALEKGFYKEAGLNVIIREASSSSEPIKDVIDGRSDFGVGTTDLLQYRSQGKPVVLLASIFQHSPLAIMVLRKSGIMNLHDLVPYPIMIEPHSAELFGYFNWEGIDISKLQLREHTNSIMDLIEGRVMAMSVYETDEPYLMEIKGIDYQIFKPAPSGIDFYGDNLFTTEQQIYDHPDRVKAFVLASLKGWEYAMSHRDEMVDIILKKYSQRKSRGHLIFEAEQMRKIMMLDTITMGYTNPSRWEKIVKTYRQLNMLPNGYKLKGFFYSEYITPPYYIFYKLTIFLLWAAIILLFMVIPFFIYYRHLQYSEERYRLLADNLFNVVWTMDLQGRFKYVSPSVIKQRGYTPEEAIQQSLEEILTPESYELIKENFTGYIQTGEITQTKWLLHQLCKDGTCILTEVTLSPMKDAKGRKIGLIGVSRDVTEQQRAEDILRVRLIAIESTSDAVVITDAEGHIEYINPAFTEITGYFIDDVLGKTMRILQSGEHSREFYEQLWAAINNGETWRGEIINRRKDNRIYFEEQTISPVFNKDGHVERFVAIKRDITHKKHLENQLTHKAFYDNLTQLPNRTLFLDRLNQSIQKYVHDDSPFVLFYLDLDEFKEINDIYGHDHGDFVLQEVSNRLRNLLRKCDTVARFGGDEFLILLLDIENQHIVTQLAEKVITAISKPISLDNHEFHISVSIGVSQFPKDGKTAEKLLQIADKRMYCAKNSGKNRICYSD